MSNIFPLGPSGGPGGGFFNDIQDQLGGFEGLAFSTSISRLQVNAGETLDHLQVTYQSGVTTIGPIQHGASSSGAVFPAFDLLLASGERLHKIEGWIADFDGTFEVHGLRFTTTTGRQSGVLGSTSDRAFVFEAPPGGEIMSLWGRQGLFLDALGVFVRTP